MILFVQSLSFAKRFRNFENKVIKMNFEMWNVPHKARVTGQGDGRATHHNESVWTRGEDVPVR